MSLSQLEKNLLVFLDPCNHYKEGDWIIIRPQNRKPDPALLQGRNLLLRYPRRNLIGYLYCALTAWFGSRFKGTKVRRGLYLNDGLLCSIFDADKTACYHAFARNHLPRPTGLRRRIATSLPPFWRADQRFVVIENNPPSESENLPPEFGALDYLFFSNPKGKLMLTKAETFLSGNGTLFKTTAVPRYNECLQHEHATIKNIRQRLQHSTLLQGPDQLQVINRRSFYTEEYLQGKNLREVLRQQGANTAMTQTCRLIDQLDAWFAAYRSAFSGATSSFSLLYADMLHCFGNLYANDTDSKQILRYIRSLLSRLDNDHAGVVPITAHNDLWPGNFIVKKDHLIAVDWERATEQSTPLFDYFWMIISTTLEYLVGKNGVQDYSNAFRQFLNRQDEVCCHAQDKLELFLDSLGLDRILKNRFMLLFLMEWSIKGFQSLGRVTDMDQLAYGELAAFVAETPCTGDSP